MHLKAGNGTGWVPDTIRQDSYFTCVCSSDGGCFSISRG